MNFPERGVVDSKAFRPQINILTKPNGENTRSEGVCQSGAVEIVSQVRSVQDSKRLRWDNFLPGKSPRPCKFQWLVGLADESAKFKVPLL